MGQEFKINSNEIEKQMVEEYCNGVSAQVLMSKYNYKTKKSIYDKVRKHKGKDFDFTQIAKQKKTYSFSLSSIDSYFNAYFIGLMLTDGYIVDERKFGIELTDEDCIAFLATITGHKYNSYESSVEGNKTRHRIIFSDKQVVEELKRYNITERKTHSLGKFNIKDSESKFIPYLIRGIIDGDGCITKTAYGSPMFSISASSYDFIVWLKEILQNRLFMYIDAEIYQDPRTQVYTLLSSNRHDIDILKLLVYDKPFGMSRKYNILHERASETIMGDS